MSTELETYARELMWLLDQIAGCIATLTPDQRSWQPLPSANPPAVIATHVVSVTRVYALGFGCGQAVTRDRAAEFAAPLAEDEAIQGALRALGAEIQTVLTAASPSVLDVETIPPPELWGTGTPHAITGRAALAEAIRHAGIHLGELRLTCDLARAHG